MSVPRIAAPTYILREEASTDLFEVLGRLAELGFDGVELMGLFGKEPAAVARRAQSLALEVIGVHVSGHELARRTDALLEAVAAVGATYVTIEWPEASFDPEHDGFDQAIDLMAELAQRALAANLRPLYHNHDADFYRLARPTEPDMFQLLLDRVPAFEVEPDLGWMVYSGADPAFYLRRYATRCPVVHVKDIWAEDLNLTGPKEDLGAIKRRPEKGRFEFRPTGFGLVNYPLLLPDIMACEPEWLVTDHDLAYERDPYQDLAKSLTYLRTLLDLHLT